MNFVVMALVLSFTMPELQAQHKAKPQPSVFDKLFKPNKIVPPPKPKKPVVVAKKKEPEKRTFSQNDKSPIFIVDNEWIAHYKILSDLYAYPIPEDKSIEFKNGKYYVPAVVYRHYEDMMKSPRKE
jgi:hypothetical protein